MLRSFLDEVGRNRITGWAQDEAQPDAPLSLLILVDEALVARVLANRHRPDLAAAGIGDGRHGFHFDFPNGLSSGERHVVRVCREADGADLAGSPAVLEPTELSDRPAHDALADIDLAALSDAALARGIELTAEHLDRAAQLLADRHSGRAARSEHRLLLERWRRRGASGDMPVAGMPPRRALIIDDRLPQPQRDAGSAVILSHIRSLHRFGFEVSFVASLDFAADDAIPLRSKRSGSNGTARPITVRSRRCCGAKPANSTSSTCIGSRTPRNTPSWRAIISRKRARSTASPICIICGWRARPPPRTGPSCRRSPIACG
jgi:hypothetical protein